LFGCLSPGEEVPQPTKGLRSEGDYGSSLTAGATTGQLEQGSVSPSDSAGFGSGPSVTRVGAVVGRQDVFDDPVVAVPLE